MSDNDLFETTETTVDDTKNYLSELVGEGKTYKDAEALAKAVQFKQQYIDRLETEHKGMRADLETRTRLEEVLQKLTQKSQERDESAQGTGNQSERTGGEGTALTTEQITTIAKQALQETQEQSRRDNNLREVKQELVSKLGSNYAPKLREQATMLGMNETALNRIAEENPKAFYRLMGMDTQKKQENTFSTSSTVNSAGLNINLPNKDKNYYQELRRTKPNEYWSIPVQKEIHAKGFAAANQGKDIDFSL